LHANQVHRTRSPMEVSVPSSRGVSLMRRVVTLFATAGMIAGMVVLSRGPADQRRDHKLLVRRLRELHTEPSAAFNAIPALGSHAQWLIGG
jgi:hypothetical protein